MTAPVVPNLFAPVAAILIDPANGQPYKVGSSDVAVASLPVPNINAPVGCSLIDPTTGIPYH